MDGVKKFLEKKYKISHAEAQAASANSFMMIVSVGFTISHALCAIQQPGYQIIYIFLSMNAFGGTRFVTRSIFIISTNPIEYFGTILATFSIMQIGIAFTTSLWTNLTVNVLGGNYGEINLIMAGLSLFSCVFPISIAIIRWKEHKNKLSFEQEKGEVNKAVDEKQD